jgi:hypothetical protein
MSEGWKGFGLLNIEVLGEARTGSAPKSYELVASVKLSPITLPKELIESGRVGCAAGSTIPSIFPRSVSSLIAGSTGGTGGTEEGGFRLPRPLRTGMGDDGVVRDNASASGGGANDCDCEKCGMCSVSERNLPLLRDFLRMVVKMLSEDLDFRKSVGGAICAVSPLVELAVDSAMLCDSLGRDFRAAARLWVLGCRGITNETKDGLCEKE